MSKAKKKSAQNGILFYDEVVYGDSGPKIVQFAKDKKFDLIVIGSRGHSGVKELFLGSVANGVVHKTKVPIMVVK